MPQTIPFHPRWDIEECDENHHKGVLYSNPFPSLFICRYIHIVSIFSCMFHDLLNIPSFDELGKNLIAIKTNSVFPQCAFAGTLVCSTTVLKYFHIKSWQKTYIYISYLTLFPQCICRYIPGANTFTRMFHDLLNIPSCEELPDLSVYRRQLEKDFCEKFSLEQFSSYLTNLAVMYVELF